MPNIDTTKQDAAIKKNIEAGGKSGSANMAPDDYNYLGLGNYDLIDKAKYAYGQEEAAAKKAAAENAQSLEDYKNLVNQYYGKSPEEYSGAVEDYLNSPGYDYDDFHYEKNTNDFLQPEMTARVDTAMNALDTSAGSDWSDSMKSAMQAKQKALAGEQWSKSYNHLMKDRSSELADYTQNKNQYEKEYGSQQDKLKNLVALYGTDRDSESEGLDDYLKNKIEERNSELETTAGIQGGMANAEEQRKGVAEALPYLIAAYYGK